MGCLHFHQRRLRERTSHPNRHLQMTPKCKKWSRLSGENGGFSCAKKGGPKGRKKRVSQKKIPGNLKKSHSRCVEKNYPFPYKTPCIKEEFLRRLPHLKICNSTANPTSDRPDKNRMFNLGGLEILVILVVALLVLGPDKLPGFMRVAGRFMGEARRASTEFQRSINASMAEDTDKAVHPAEGDQMPDAPDAANTPAAPPAPPALQTRRIPGRVQTHPSRNSFRLLRKPGRTRNCSATTETP